LGPKAVSLKRGLVFLSRGLNSAVFIIYALREKKTENVLFIEGS